MPTVTSLVRDGEMVKVRWSIGHCGILLQWMKEENSLPEYKEPVLFPDSYVFLKDHSMTFAEDYMYSDGDPDKTETFEVKAGAKYECWHESKR